MRNVQLTIFLTLLTSSLVADNSLNYYNTASSTFSNHSNYHTSSDTSNFNSDRTGRLLRNGGTERSDANNNTRSYVDGISSLSTDTYTPLNVGVMTPAGMGLGSVNLQKREFTETVWEFSTNDLDPSQNIFDSGGRGVLVDGKLSCRVTHRETLSDYYMGGLALGLTSAPVVPGVVAVTANAGATFELLKNNYWESSQSCAVGPIPAYTTANAIAKLCVPCHTAVLETLKQDVRSRMNALTYLVTTNLCKSDKECESSGDDGRVITKGLVGRCVLVKDKNGSHFSECRPRTLEGRGCPGPGSSGLLEYPCDKGLECVKVREGNKFWNWSGSYDYDDYVCLKRKKSR